MKQPYYIYAFEKLEVWQLARIFRKDMYLVTENFPGEEKFGLTSQIRRAASSITVNLAKGSGRALRAGGFAQGASRRGLRAGGFAQGMAGGFAQGIAGDFARGMAGGFAQGIAGGFAQGIAGGFAQGIAGGFAQGMAGGFAQGSSRGLRAG